MSHHSLFGKQILHQVFCTLIANIFPTKPVILANKTNISQDLKVCVKEGTLIKRKQEFYDF